jgi:limonene 1,2-monooxygenase
MDFALFINGLRPDATAEAAFEQDLREIVVADELGFTEAWVSEHHAERIYLPGSVQVLPAPEMLLCRAAGLTSQIRLGPAVRVLHTQHPVDLAEQAAAADHVIGGGRYMFGFGSGFPNAHFSTSRGLAHDERSGRGDEALEIILKCWASDEPFDWDGRYFQLRDVMVLPKPLARPHMPMLTATFTDAKLRMAGARGYGLLGAPTAPDLRRASDIYCEAARDAGVEEPLRHIRATRFVFVADSVAEATELMRPAVEWELGLQRARGIQLNASLDDLGADKKPLEAGMGPTFEELIDLGIYTIGDPDTVVERLTEFHEESGGFGTLTLVMGKSWTTAERREESLRRFAAEVAPRLRHLGPSGPWARPHAGADRR